MNRLIARVSLIAAAVVMMLSANRPQPADALPSWNEGASKKALTDFIARVTREGSDDFVPVNERIAVFDNDGTLWAEKPVYFQVAFAMDRVRALAPQHPEWKNTEPFKSLLAGDVKTALAGGEKAIGEILAVTHAGMTVTEFDQIVTDWITTAKHPKTGKLYSQMIYQPMLEVLAYLRANGYKTYIVTGGGQDFVRVYAEQTYGIPPEQVVGSATGTTYGCDKDGRPFLTKDPKLLIKDNDAGKPESIHLMIGRRPYAAFGNSTGDQQMLEYTAAGDGARLCMLAIHDDAGREYAYGPAQGLPDTKVGTFSDTLYGDAIAKGWTVISMKNDWNTIFAFDN